MIADTHIDESGRRTPAFVLTLQNGATMKNTIAYQLNSTIEGHG